MATRKVGRGNAHQLDDKGWVRVHEELNFASPRARALGGALAALHGNLRDRVLSRCGPTFGYIFGRSDPARSAPTSGREPPADLEARIRAAYTALAGEPGGWVSLTRVRPRREAGRPLTFQPLPGFRDVLDDPDEFNEAVEAAVASLAPGQSCTAGRPGRTSGLPCSERPSSITDATATVG